MILCEYEVQVLRTCAGEAVDGLCWGAAMSVALESLQGAGLIDRCRGVYFATEAGAAWLSDWRGALTPPASPPEGGP